MSKHRLTGFQKRVKPEDAHEVRIAAITIRGDKAVCSCGGWTSQHARKKVLEESAQRHLDRKHGKVGIWV